MDKERKITIAVVVGCLALVAGIATWVINVNNSYAVTEITEEEAAAYCPDGYEYYGGSELYYGGKVICCPSAQSTVHRTGPKDFNMTSARDVCYMNINANEQTSTCDDAGIYTVSKIGNTYYCSAAPKKFEIEGYYYVTLSLNGNGGTVKNSGTGTNAGSTYDAVNYFEYGDWYAEKDGFFFTGWSLDGSCESPKKTGTYEFTSDGNLTLTACYVDGYTVSFYDTDRNLLKEVKVEPDTVIPADEIPTEIDINGEGGNDEGFWSTTDTCDNYFSVTRKKITEDMSLYACLYYDIIFYKPNSSGNYEEILHTVFAPGSTVYELKQDISASDLVIEGKTFSHWSYSSSSCSASYMLDDDEPLEAKNIELYACYTDGSSSGGDNTNNGEYTVVLNAPNASIYEVLTGKTLNNTATEVVTEFYYDNYVPSKNGYNFIGWTSDSNCPNDMTTGLIKSGKMAQSLLATNPTLTACFKSQSSSGDNNNGSNVENPNTGSFMLYIVYVIGICSLIYTGYYIYKLKRNNN